MLPQALYSSHAGGRTCGSHHRTCGDFSILLGPALHGSPPAAQVPEWPQQLLFGGNWRQTFLLEVLSTLH
jgi:hypothetical protein